ncbi:hypothetical protein RJT34_02916 [Clitoria ternatea]|uniref:Uncharacterized protein n=1 Tax=Clitoria ternatea TaxID=43366 RepID=A0AAN9KL85_CLITE
MRSSTENATEGKRASRSSTPQQRTRQREPRERAEEAKRAIQAEGRGERVEYLKCSFSLPRLELGLHVRGMTDMKLF